MQHQQVLVGRLKRPSEKELALREQLRQLSEDAKLAPSLLRAIGHYNAMKPETAFRKNRVLPFLKTLEHTSYFPIQQLAISGDADYILCSRGKFVWLELKDEGEDLRPLQMFKADWVKKTGGIPLRAGPDNWEQVKSLLLNLDQGET